MPDGGLCVSTDKQNLIRLGILLGPNAVRASFVYLTLAGDHLALALFKVPDRDLTRSVLAITLIVRYLHASVLYLTSSARLKMIDLASCTSTSRVLHLFVEPKKHTNYLIFYPISHTSPFNLEKR